MKQNKFLLISAIAFCVAVICSGGFYGYAAALTGVLLCAAWFCMLLDKRAAKSTIVNSGRPNWDFILPAALLIYTVPVVFFAVDRPAHFAGAIKWSPLLLWLYLMFQTTQGEREIILSLIPRAGVCMTLIGVLSLLTPATKSLFWMADRFGGTFQYANTCALFLSVGILILIGQLTREVLREKSGDGKQDADDGKRWKEKRMQIVRLIVLTVGVLLTGSRSVLLLLLAFCFWKAVRVPALRKPLALVVFLTIVAALVAFFATGNVQNIGRVLTLTTYQSTFWGRLLYMKDALRMIARFPLGVGFSGYYYIQPSFQNGVYTTRFVHNDYLQTALDIGLLPAVVLIAYLIRQLACGRQGSEKKEMLLFFLIGALFDFHFQYLAIAMTAALCLDLGDYATETSKARPAQTSSEKKKKVTRRGMPRVARYENMACAVLLAIAYFYFLVPFMAFRLGDDETVLRFYPHETETERRLLEEAQTAEEAEYYARELLSHNAYLVAPYRHLAYASLMRGDVEGALDNLDRVIAINRYRVEEYEAYDALLGGLLQTPIENDAPTTADGAAQETTMQETTAPSGMTPRLYERAQRTKQALPEILRALETTTDPLAFLLRDQPVFEMHGE